MSTQGNQFEGNNSHITINQVFINPVIINQIVENPNQEKNIKSKENKKSFWERVKSILNSGWAAAIGFIGRIWPLLLLLFTGC